VGRKLLVSAFRLRTTLSYRNFRRFGVEVEEQVRPDEAKPKEKPDEL
jgi:hypothetical protein